MESIIIDSLEDLGYPGPVCEGDNFEKALDDGPASVAFTQLIEWLTKELKHLCDLEESVNAINVSQDSSNFMLELSGFLREFGCPYSSLTEGPISERLSTRESRLQLLDYLTTELASTRMIAVDKPAALISKAAEPERQTNESELGNYMKIMVIALGFSKPPANITATKLFSKVESKIKELLTKHPYQIGKPLLKTRLSEKHWNHIMNINNALTTEYCTRREMLLKRLDVTIQSFMWSDKAKKRENDIAKVYQPIRKQLTSKTEIGVTEILAAREDLLRIWKTSSGKSREETKCAINRVLIGRVPDRGGRAWEHEPPPPEMPAFQKRQPGGRGGGQGGLRDGGHTGGSQRGRVKGGWGDNQQQQQGGQWGQNRSGYGGQNPHGYQQNFNQQADYHGQSNYGGGNRHGQDRGGGGYNSYDGRGSYNNGRGGYNDGGGSRRGGRGGRGGWGRGGSGSRY